MKTGSFKTQKSYLQEAANIIYSLKKKKNHIKLLKQIFFGKGIKAK